MVGALSPDSRSENYALTSYHKAQVIIIYVPLNTIATTLFTGHTLNWCHSGMTFVFMNTYWGDDTHQTNTLSLDQVCVSLIPKMELRHLRYFVMAAEEGNISRAAARLHVSQPAVSRQIRDLEEEFGLSLFERKRDGLALTEDGQTALSHAREVFRQANVLSETMLALRDSDGITSLRIGYIPTALPGFLAQGLRQFRQQHRNVCVQIYEMSPSEQELALREERIDLALLVQPCPVLKRTYETRPIRKVPMALALPENHRLAHRKEIDLSELSQEIFLSLHEKHFPGRPVLLRTLFDKVGIAPKVALKVDGLSELLGQVGIGGGVALIPSDADTLPHPGVCFVALRRPKTMLVSSAVWRKGGENSELLEEFVEELACD